MVNHHQIICKPTAGASIANRRKNICSLRDFGRIYSTALTTWCCLKSPDSNSNAKFRRSCSSSSRSHRTSDSAHHSNSTPDSSTQEIEEETNREDETMKGEQSFVYTNGESKRGDTSNSSSSGDRYFKHKSVDNCPSSASRNGSRKGSPSPSFLYRSKSRGSIADFHNGSLSRNTSSRKPIMFSNSTGLIKPTALHKSLECTLEELCYGCTKKIKVTRDVITNTGLIIQEDEMLTINVKPGWKKGTKVTFEGMGNERPGSLPSDITFVIAEKKHPLFRREGDNLELKIEIPLIKALTGCEISIPLLGGNTLSLRIDDIIHPGFHKIIQGQGMPNTKHHGQRGDLKVIFLVEFPTRLTRDQRSELVSILQDSC